MSSLESAKAVLWVWQWHSAYIVASYLLVAHSEDVHRRCSVSDESDADGVWSDVELVNDVDDEVADQVPVGTRVVGAAADFPRAVHDEDEVGSRERAHTRNYMRTIHTTPHGSSVVASASEF